MPEQPFSVVENDAPVEIGAVASHRSSQEETTAAWLKFLNRKATGLVKSELAPSDNSEATHYASESKEQKTRNWLPNRILSVTVLKRPVSTPDNARSPDMYVSPPVLSSELFAEDPPATEDTPELRLPEPVIERVVAQNTEPHEVNLRQASNEMAEIPMYKDDTNTSATPRSSPQKRQAPPLAPPPIMNDGVAVQYETSPVPAQFPRTERVGIPSVDEPETSTPKPNAADRSPHTYESQRNTPESRPTSIKDILQQNPPELKPEASKDIAKRQAEVLAQGDYASVRPETVQQAVSQLAEQDAPLEGFYDRRAEKDKDNAVSAANPAVANPGSFTALHSPQFATNPLLQQATAVQPTAQPTIAPYPASNPGTQYRQAIASGFGAAVIVGVIAIIIYLL